MLRRRNSLCSHIKKEDHAVKIDNSVKPVNTPPANEQRPKAASSVNPAAPAGRAIPTDNNDDTQTDNLLTTTSLVREDAAGRRHRDKAGEPTIRSRMVNGG